MAIKQVTNRKLKGDAIADAVASTVKHPKGGGLPAVASSMSEPTKRLPPGRSGKLLTTPGASTYTGLSVSCLERLQREGTGPRRVQVTPETWRYHVDDLDAWMAELPTSTSGSAARIAAIQRRRAQAANSADKSRTSTHEPAA
ncbi:AlpA family transcriptional regulator [Cupriavidus sp. AcVe19-6a]|uniref:helix-turn-helix transcriptional regulator n=1 Tax=Cupriavidus sp. AcVe19-6a TaxID=2821358 RepID=UPI001AE2E00B|nr:hypothetical protein [Cupriavidus sp. AcVe19-6a]MBP0635520.1 hypothetical protein [Cupriavidus sp. AcVe19-6a]